MQQNLGIRALQQEAYRRGGEVKRAHVQKRSVLQGMELVMLSADVAHLMLFKESQQPRETTNPSERAGLCMRAFWRGYEDGPLGVFDEAARGSFPDTPRRLKRRRGRHRFPAPSGI